MKPTCTWLANGWHDCVTVEQRLSSGVLEPGFGPSTSRAQALTARTGTRISEVATGCQHWGGRPWPLALSNRKQALS